MSLLGYGRSIIYTNYDEINDDNVVEVLKESYIEHLNNRADIVKLWEYYRGKTDILMKVKEVRENINHKICENRAYEIANFYNGYTFGEPIQYIRRENTKSKDNSDDELAEEINALNGYMADANKPSCDKELAERLHACGTSYRLTLPNPEWKENSDEPPFNVYALDPENTYVVYHSGFTKKPLMAVRYVSRDDSTILYSIYTKDKYYEITSDDKIEKIQSHVLGTIPIIEYPSEAARLGVFEIVIPLLDAINELQSNRMDNVVQFVNSFLALLGGEINQETYDRLEEYKMLCLPEGVDAKYLSSPMAQADIQTLKDDLWQSALEICGIPNRNGGSSTSDTGSAVIMRDGWQDAEARAKGTELSFKKSEKLFLKLVLRILRDTVGTKLKLTDIEPHFTRRNYENIASKSQVLIAMLNSEKIHPELAFAHCGMFADPESAYLQSEAWIKEKQKQAEKEMQDYVNSLGEDDGESVQNSRQSDNVSA